MNDISVLIIKASEKQASDLYIRENTYPYIRNKEGNVILLDASRVSAHEIQSFFKDILIKEITKLPFDLDFSYQISGINCRCHSYRTIHGMALAIRILPQKIPTLNQLGLPDSVSELVMYSHHFRYRLEVGASCSIQLLL